jgi:hypothetical protein
LEALRPQQANKQKTIADEESFDCHSVHDRNKKMKNAYLPESAGEPPVNNVI